MKEYERLNNNLKLLELHNETHKPIFHLTNGQTHEVDLIRDIISDCRGLLNKIENGTLIELPCKVGKILYEVCEKPNDNLFVKLPSEFFIVEHRVCDIKIRMIGKKPIFAIFTSNKEFGVMTWDGEHIGSQLFLTKAEAEKKLKELKGK